MCIYVFGQIQILFVFGQILALTQPSRPSRVWSLPFLPSVSPAHTCPVAQRSALLVVPMGFDLQLLFFMGSLLPWSPRSWLPSHHSEVPSWIRSSLAILSTLSPLPLRHQLSQGLEARNAAKHPKCTEQPLTTKNYPALVWHWELLFKGFLVFSLYIFFLPFISIWDDVIHLWLFIVCCPAAPNSWWNTNSRWRKALPVMVTPAPLPSRLTRVAWKLPSSRSYTYKGSQQCIHLVIWLLFLFLFIYLINLFIYFLFLAVSGPCCRARASHCSGFSCCGAWSLGARASVVVACGL